MTQFNNPIPVAVGIVELQDGKTGEFSLLGIRRNIEPNIGGVAFPGGYLDQGETAEMAMSRELQEETGLYVPAADWLLVGTEITDQNRLLVFMVCQYTLSTDALDAYVANSEVQELVVIKQDTTLCFPTHAKWANSYFNELETHSHVHTDACNHG